jgi:hypothetical protein
MIPCQALVSAVGSASKPVHWQIVLLSRFAPRAGLVLPRQTFVPCSQTDPNLAELPCRLLPLAAAVPIRPARQCAPRQASARAHREQRRSGGAPASGSITSTIARASARKRSTPVVRIEYLRARPWRQRARPPDSLSRCAAGQQAARTACIARSCALRKTVPPGEYRLTRTGSRSDRLTHRC